MCDLDAITLAAQIQYWQCSHVRMQCDVVVSVTVALHAVFSCSILGRRIIVLFPYEVQGARGPTES